MKRLLPYAVGAAIVIVSFFAGFAIGYHVLNNGVEGKFITVGKE